MGQAVNHADGTPKDFEDISIATEWASFKIVKMKKLFFLSHSLWSFDLFLCAVFLLTIRLPFVNKLELSWYVVGWSSGVAVTHLEAGAFCLCEKTRSSATAEGQCVSYTRLSRPTHWSCTSLSTASVLQLYNRLAELVSTLSAKKPCDIRTLSWIGHSSSFKVILIGPGRNPKWSVVVMCN